jgi:hypothetical protein
MYKTFFMYTYVCVRVAVTYTALCIVYLYILVVVTYKIFLIVYMHIRIRVFVRYEAFWTAYLSIRMSMTCKIFCIVYVFTRMRVFVTYKAYCIEYWSLFHIKVSILYVCWNWRGINQLCSLYDVSFLIFQSRIMSPAPLPLCWRWQMTKPCANNADGVEDKLKGCYNLRKGTGVHSLSAESQIWKGIVIKMK